MKKGGKCCPIGLIAQVLLVVTLALLLLVNLEVLSGSFATLVTTWWPAGVLVYALHGFCPCGCCGSCKV